MRDDRPFARGPRPFFGVPLFRLPFTLFFLHGEAVLRTYALHARRVLIDRRDWSGVRFYCIRRLENFLSNFGATDLLFWRSAIRLTGVSPEFGIA